MVGFPVEIVTGQLAPDAIAFGFAVQVAWLALAFVLARVVWARGVQRYSAIGG